MNNIKETLNLPKTKFSMQGNLIKQEPEKIKKWKQEKLYNIIKKSKKNIKKKFILHDGPPYANGNIHIGHALNKILKDIIIRSKHIAGCKAEYIPSWDCHGLPIEHKIEEINKKKKISNKVFRKKCKKYVIKNIDNQQKDFIRLGILADWKKKEITMDFINQSNIILTLSKIFKKGYLYKKYKPVYWCIKCKSALAEAEIEYKKKISPGIMVIFEIKKNKITKKKINIIRNIKKKINIIIWTTTPWTLPSNVAIAVNPKTIYQLVKTKLYTVIIAKNLVYKIMEKLKIKNWKIILEIKGKFLKNIKFKHPFLNITVPIILSKYVTENTGTGCVHIAPDHGQEDFLICKKYKISTKNIIDSKGMYRNNIHPMINKKNIFKSNKKIINILKKEKKFLHNKKIKHNYPYCWRHKYPIIFRATLQWFINMDKNQLRKKCINLIKKVNWIPKWGYKRMKKMLEKRPDWCISRQRNWGIPITFYINKKTNKIHPKMYLLIKKISKIIKKKGTENWWNNDINKIIKINEEKYKKTKDVLDVWFESGALYISKIFNSKKKKKNIADIYIEGSDQYRGWFMSSLIISVIIQKQAPYKTVLTHGFSKDEDGYKMSKSLKNTISPNDIVKKFGADILRLLVSSTNYCNDFTISNQIIAQSIENYKKIRNTIRFLLANLKNFDYKKKKIKKKNILKIDQWIILRTQKLQKQIIYLYSKYRFHEIVQKIMKFCITKLSAFYLDIIKDRQYTLNEKNKARYSSQNTILYILNSLVKWLYPILPFTTDEIWKLLPKKKKQIFFTKWSKKKYIFKKKTKFDTKFWNKMIKIKNEVNKTIELLRKKKKINSSLETIVILYTKKTLQKKIQILKQEKKFFFITSGVKIKNFKKAPKNAIKSKKIKNLKIKILKHKGEKCPRCWNYTKKIIILKNKKKFCKRCLLNLFGTGEVRKIV